MKNKRLEHPEGLDLKAAEFYGDVLRRLRDARIPFLVGGGIAFSTYTGIVRDTKDLDLFVLPSSVQRVLELLAKANYRTDNKYPHWLAKVYHDDRLIDVIYCSGNGICPVTEDWFQHGIAATVIDQPVQLMGAEEMIWQKAFIMERHRYDGADIINLLHACHERLDWPRLLMRFEQYRLVLLSHLLLYRFVYPEDDGTHVNAAVGKLVDYLPRDLKPLTPSESPLCRGTLLSLLEYLPAIEQWGYRDARIKPDGNMTPVDVAHWQNTFER
jgi:hypothetical protein